MPPGSHVSRLAELVGGKVEHFADPLITDVTHRSDLAAEGSLFVAIVGHNSDGHDFVDDAVEKGALAVAVQRPIVTSVPQIEVEDTRDALGRLAAEVHGNPSLALDVVGVTGTNGKTTITHFVDSIARTCGVISGLIGTIRVVIDDKVEETKHTTPEASEFQRLLARMRDHKVGLVAAEVSSHALEFGRVRGTRFAVAAFTNLTQDHLDFHGTMDAYGQAKKRLFTDYDVGTAVVNIDDPIGLEIAGSYDGSLVTVGLLGDVNFSDLTAIPGGTRFQLTTPWGSRMVDAPVVGVFNVENLTMAAACCLAVGLPFEGVADALVEVDQVPGRFEIVSGSDPVVAVVDYAHTPDSVRSAIAAARELTDQRVVAVVGAGGDRDSNKRPLMGQALSAADVAVVTTDNPRSEEPGDILDAVVAGVTTSELIVELDRKKAIAAALNTAAEGDVVLILGRGHEPFQQVGSQKIPFDDREVTAELLSALRKSANLEDGSGSMGS